MLIEQQIAQRRAGAGDAVLRMLGRREGGYAEFGMRRRFCSLHPGGKAADFPWNT